MPAKVTVKTPDNNGFKLGKDLKYGDVVYVIPFNDGIKRIYLVMFHPNNDAKKGIVELENPFHTYMVMPELHYEMAPNGTEILIKVED